MESGNERPRRKPRKLEKRSVDEGHMAMQASQHDDDMDARQPFERRDSELTELPVDEHSFLNNDNARFVNQLDAASDGDSMDEGALRRHFMDVESSFIPDVAPQGVQEGRLGVDDTYLDLGKPGHTPPPDEMFQRLSGRMTASARRSHRPDEERQPQAEVTPPHSFNDLEGDESQDSPSSPAAAASHRTHTRNLSTASATRITPVRATSISIKTDGSAQNSRPTSSAARPTSKGSTVRPGSSEGASLLSLNGVHSMSPSRLTTRPSYQGGRQASHHSSASEATLTSDISGSDTVDADYALQTGGAVSGSSQLRGGRAVNMLSRLPSMGSVASYIDRDSEDAPPLSRGFSGSLLTSRMNGRLDGQDDERPETPRASASNVQAPTDTVLAQRVESIQVPETIARDFRARNRSLSPEKRPTSAGGPGVTFQDRPRRTLTLKEQNGKLDKLTKENFDLKLKIHFLDQALQSRSDDGVKELIDKNVQFQTDLANERKETQNLRRRVRELERKSKEQEDGLAEAQQRKGHFEQDRDDDDPTLQAEMHEEILYLRQQLDHSENSVSTLREEVMTKELEKRKMAEHMRSMAGNRGEDTAGMKETMDMWQDLLNAETGRREQAEDDIRRLRDELTTMRIERSSPAANRVEKIAKRRSNLGHVQGVSDEDLVNGVNGMSTESSSIHVEHLRHENAELRRDLGAQTSMLTSRNRERERLQQEIEDLKLLQRKSDGARSVAGESIFERSISRAHQRASSRASDHTQATQVTETERDDWERKEGGLRDQNAELRLKFQDLERTHSTHLQYVSALEGDFQEMEQELNEAAEDLRALQSERDEALHAFEDKEAEYEKLEQEALTEIDKLVKEVQGLEVQLQEAHKKHLKTQTKLEHTTDGYKGLQGELREITQSVMNLEDEKQANMKTIETLEQQLAEAEDEIQRWEQKCKELDSKNRKLEITQESLHNEITFLREEQEGDKIKIGELEDALNAAQQTIQDEQEKLREMEEGIAEERQQRDVLEDKSKEEVQKVLDDLNSEGGKSKDEVRKLRRALSAKEVEASTWKQKLEELEQSLRNALGDPNGTKPSLLSEIERLQRELESTANGLDRAKMDVADKDRLLRHRDGLLESTSLESRRLSDLLDKERASRKHDLDMFEKTSRGQASHMRTVAQKESQILELETKYSQDKRKMSQLEQQFRDQLHERNNLLLALWNRLSTLCGADWAQSHSLVNGEVPSVEVIQRSLPGFNKNVITAVKTIEALIGSFKVRIRSTEKELWRDYQTLEHNLDLRIQKMDALEQGVKDAQKALAEEAAKQRMGEAASRPQPNRSMSSFSIKGSDELNKLRVEVKNLKTELKFHRQHPSPMAQQMLNQQAQLNPQHDRRQSNGGQGSRAQSSPARAFVAQLLRHHSTSAVEQLAMPLAEEPRPTSRQQPIVLATPPIQPSEQRWNLRLKEMERRLKAEREARLLDRRGARQRLEEGRLENEELRQMLEREKSRRDIESVMEGSVAGSERRDSEPVNEREVD